jgi:NarL family two-component system response regulator LiaR
MGHVLLACDEVVSMSDSKCIRVMTVDDHQLLRRGIRFSLLSVDDIEVVAEAQSGEEAMRLCEEARPDVVLMDMRLVGGMDGVAATQAIRSHCPQVQVLALSSFHDRDLVQGAMQAGAIGYLVKGTSAEELAEAIRAAHAGRPTLATEAIEVLVQPAVPAPALGHDLTVRELEVLALLVEGLSNAKIAARLYVSVAAVKYHVSGILSKLGAANRTEAAALAREHKLLAEG